MEDYTKIEYVYKVLSSCETYTQLVECKDWGYDIINRTLFTELELNDFNNWYESKVAYLVNQN